MGLTDNSDIYLAIHETGINLLLKHVTRQRPSLVNLGTAAVAAEPNLLCALPDVDPAVTDAHNRLVNVVSLPATINLQSFVPSSSDGSLAIPNLSAAPFPSLDFCAQLVDIAIDFYPGSIDLPSPLAPLPEQMMAVRARVAAGLRNRPTPGTGDPPLSCFTVTAAAVSGVKATTDGAGGLKMAPVPGGLVFLGFGPAGLLNSLNLLIDRFLKQSGNIPQEGYLMPFKGLISLPSSTGPGGRITVIPTLAKSPNLPHNPAIEEDELKLWVNLSTKLVSGDIPAGDAGTIHIDVVAGGTAETETAPAPMLAAALSGGSGMPASTSGAVLAATASTAQPVFDWTGPIPDAPAGPDHLTLGVSGAWVDQQFDLAKRDFSFESKKHLEMNQMGGKVLFDYDLKLHLASGKVIRTNTGSFGLQDVDIAWDRMNFKLGLCIPQQCVDVPALGRHCVFGGTPAHPDINVPIDLKNYLTSEVGVVGTPTIRYGRNTLRPAGMTDRQAVAAGQENKWGVFVHPDKVDVDPIDVDDTVNNIIAQAVKDAIAQATSSAPAWAANLLATLLGSAQHLLATLLGLPDQLNEWLGEKIGIDLDLIADLETALAQHFITFPLFSLPDPFTVLPEDTKVNPPLVRVLVPLRDLQVKIDAQELALQGKIGPVTT